MQNEKKQIIKIHIGERLGDFEFCRERWRLRDLCSNKSKKKNSNSSNS